MVGFPSMLGWRGCQGRYLPGPYLVCCEGPSGTGLPLSSSQLTPTPPNTKTGLLSTQVSRWTGLQQPPCSTLINLSSTVPFLGSFSPLEKSFSDVARETGTSLWSLRRDFSPNTIYTSQARSLIGLAGVTCPSPGQSLSPGLG